MGLQLSHLSIKRANNISFPPILIFTTSLTTIAFPTILTLCQANITDSSFSLDDLSLSYLARIFRLLVIHSVIMLLPDIPCHLISVPDTNVTLIKIAVRNGILLTTIGTEFARVDSTVKISLFGNRNSRHTVLYSVDRIRINCTMVGL